MKIRFIEIDNFGKKVKWGVMSVTCPSWHRSFFVNRVILSRSRINYGEEYYNSNITAVA